MENLFYNISQVLGITIIHSLWQGLTIYVALSLLLQFLPDMPASSKYKLAFGALSMMLMWFAYTLYREVDSYSWLSTIPYHAPLTVTQFVPVAIEQWPTPTDRYYFVIAGYLPYVTMLYFAGLAFNTLKMILAWNNIYRIRQNIIVADFQDQVNRLAQKMNIGKYVKIAYSEFIDVPCITGFLKPIILLPCAISTYLTAEEIKAILLHELAHIRRNDYLLNLMQQAMGILLFFNPFSRLINRIINRERENCCDDVVVQITGSPLIYAQALLKLEQNKQQVWHLALAATGKKYHLLTRIERIMKTKKTTINIRPAIIALVLLACSLSSIAWFNPKIEKGKISVNSTINPLMSAFINDTTINKAKVKIQKPLVKSKVSPKKSPVKNSNDNMDDAKMQKLQAELEKHATIIENYYNSPEFQKLQADMEKRGADMEAFYNSPKWKHLQEQMDKSGADFEKLNNNPEMKKLQEQMEATGKKIEQYYNSPEYAKLQKDIEKESGLLEKSKPGSTDYKKHLNAITKMSANITAYTNNAVIKEQTALARKLGTQMKDYYNGPEYVKQRETLKAYGDSMRNAIQGPMMKQQQEEMRKLNQAMRDYQKKPEIVREKELMKAAQKQLREYFKSPEYKETLKTVQKEVAEATERLEAPERTPAPERAAKPEKAAKPERAERAPKPEKPERVRRRDTTERHERVQAPEASEPAIAPQVTEPAPKSEEHKPGR